MRATACPICDKPAVDFDQGACRSGKNPDGHFYGTGSGGERVSFKHDGEEWDILIEWVGCTASMTVWHVDGDGRRSTYDAEVPNLTIDWKNRSALVKAVKEHWVLVTVTCSNTTCAKPLGSRDDHNGHEMGTPWGYADDYIFCDECAPAAEKHFDIVGAHTDGPGAAADCPGKDDDTNPPAPHTCAWTEEERAAAKAAFAHYR